jgi:hypothetical protein
MNLVPTQLNRQLTDAVWYSVAADRFYIRGRVAFWRFVGCGLLIFGLGASAGIGLYGYSYVTRNNDSTRAIATELSKALANIHLTASAEGTVNIEPHEISLAAGQTLLLDSNSRLALEPSATVRADGEITVQGPTISIPQTKAVPSSSLPTITNFTVFKSVPFNNGIVQTGWIFLTSAQNTPTSQYCYYTEAADIPGRNVMLDIGLDRALDAPKILPKGFDLTTAFSRCVWFASESK